MNAISGERSFGKNEIVSKGERKKFVNLNIIRNYYGKDESKNIKEIKLIIKKFEEIGKHKQRLITRSLIDSLFLAQNFFLLLPKNNQT